MKEQHLGGPTRNCTRASTRTGGSNSVKRPEPAGSNSGSSSVLPRAQTTPSASCRVQDCATGPSARAPVPRVFNRFSQAVAQAKGTTPGSSPHATQSTPCPPRRHRLARRAELAADAQQRPGRNFLSTASHRVCRLLDPSVSTLLASSVPAASRPRPKAAALPPRQPPLPRSCCSGPLLPPPPRRPNPALPQGRRFQRRRPQGAPGRRHRAHRAAGWRASAALCGALPP